MNNEIKEILDYLKESATKQNLYFEINPEKAKQLLDYITNLEQENERLEKDLLDNKKAIKLFTNNSANMLEQSLDYKLRIDKAIEHIDLYIRRIHKGNYYVTPIELEYLKDILTGGNEE